MNSFSIIKHRKIYFIISSLIIIAGLINIAIRGLNYGMDFTGGTAIEINLEKEISVDEIRKITDKFDNKASIVHIGEKKDKVMIKSSKNMTTEESMKIFNEFKDKYSLKDNEPQSVQSIGPSVGKEIQKNALISIAIASVFMLIYISIRFEFRFGMAALLGLLHDILIMIAVYSLLRLTVDSTFIAAILTITGYSINDTIIIFDRIRETSSSGRVKSYANLVDFSIKKTLRRTIFTSFTTVITLIMIYILGVESIKAFALPLLIGIIVGTLSSIFIASPIWYILKVRETQKF